MTGKFMNFRNKDYDFIFEHLIDKLESTFELWRKYPESNTYKYSKYVITCSKTFNKGYMFIDDVSFKLSNYQIKKFITKIKYLAEQINREKQIELIEEYKKLIK